MRITGLIILSVVLLMMQSCRGDEYLFDWQKQLAEDIEIIDQYLADNNIEAQISRSGLRRRNPACPISHTLA